MSKDSKRILAIILTVTAPIWFIPAVVMLLFYAVHDIISYMIGVEE